MNRQNPAAPLALSGFWRSDVSWKSRNAMKRRLPRNLCPPARIGCASGGQNRRKKIALLARQASVPMQAKPPDDKNAVFCSTVLPKARRGRIALSLSPFKRISIESNPSDTAVDFSCPAQIALDGHQAENVSPSTAVIQSPAISTDTVGPGGSNGGRHAPLGKGGFVIQTHTPCSK